VFLRIPRRLVWGAALTAVVVAIVAVALALAATDSPPTRLEPVPAGSTPAEDFRNLADWLRERSES
jgi:hypothetical protein